MTRRCATPPCGELRRRGRGRARAQAALWVEARLRERVRSPRRTDVVCRARHSAECIGAHLCTIWGTGEGAEVGRRLCSRFRRAETGRSGSPDRRLTRRALHRNRSHLCGALARESVPLTRDGVTDVRMVRLARLVQAVELTDNGKHFSCRQLRTGPPATDGCPRAGTHGGGSGSRGQAVPCGRAVAAKSEGEGPRERRRHARQSGHQTLATDASKHLTAAVRRSRLQ